MFATLKAALFAILQWLFTGSVMKWLVFFFLYWLFVGVGALLDIAISQVTDATGLSDAFAGFDAHMWYVLDYFQVSTGLPMVLSALVVRFIIRRIP